MSYKRDYVIQFCKVGNAEFKFLNRQWIYVSNKTSGKLVSVPQK